MFLVKVRWAAAAHWASVARARWEPLLELMLDFYTAAHVQLHIGSDRNCCDRSSTLHPPYSSPPSTPTTHKWLWNIKAGINVSFPYANAKRERKKKKKSLSVLPVSIVFRENRCRPPWDEARCSVLGRKRVKGSWGLLCITKTNHSANKQLYSWIMDKLSKIAIKRRGGESWSDRWANERMSGCL